ncbi:Histone-lysine N-methyltransferase EHMT1 isoform X5 [Aphelenchoides besseyi]|nr:Histone-lysine N-methyltransferase EHMT1 isoform X5 [Aphelenchoides besseyi]
MDSQFNYVLDNVRRPQHAAGETICLCPDGDCNTTNCSCYTRSTIKLKNNKVKDLNKLLNQPMEILMLECRRNCTCKGKCKNDHSSDENTMPVIDAKLTSNISRFINHSCDPCLSPFIFVRSTKSSIKFPQIGFVANQDIIAGQEVTISYGEAYWQVSGMECYCGRTKCIQPISNEEEYEREKLEEKEEKSRNEQLVKEYQRCKQRMEMIKQGFTFKEVLDQEAKESRKKKSRSKRKELSRREHRPDSPLMPPSIICID